MSAVVQYSVRCDLCRVEESVVQANSEAKARSDSARIGWRVTELGSDACPRCVAKARSGVDR